VAGLSASLLAAAATAAYAWLVGPLLRAVLTGESVSLAGLELPPDEMLRRLPLLVVAVAAVKATAQFLQGGWMQRLGQRVMADLRGFFYSRLLSQPPAFFEQRHSGELLSRFTADVPLVEFSVTQALSSYVKDGMQILALLVTCALIDAKLFLLTFVVMPATVVPVTRFARSLKKVATRSQASLAVLSSLTSEQLQNLPVVQAYGGVPRALATFDAPALMALNSNSSSSYTVSIRNLIDGYAVLAIATVSIPFSSGISISISTISGNTSVVLRRHDNSVWASGLSAECIINWCGIV
jgi:subfamily B ATP-binding cassette protein MsbA